MNNSNVSQPINDFRGLIFTYSICDYWFFSYVERKCFTNGWPESREELIQKLFDVFEDINQNHKDIIKKAWGNFEVLLNNGQ